MMSLTVAQHLRFQVLTGRISIDKQRSVLPAMANHQRPLMPADYASTSGLILRPETTRWRDTS